jgi:anti-sigma B factor antagonist
MSPGSHSCTLSPDPEPFGCDVLRERETARLRVRGALDMATVPVLEAEVTRVRDGGVARLVLDLSGLGFMDSTGLRCILELDAASRQDGFSIALIPGPPAVQRVFEVTGTTAPLPFIDV